MDAELMLTDPLEFKDCKSYADRIVAEQKRTGCGMLPLLDAA